MSRVYEGSEVDEITNVSALSAVTGVHEVTETNYSFDIVKYCNKNKITQ